MLSYAIMFGLTPNNFIWFSEHEVFQTATPD